MANPTSAAATDDIIFGGDFLSGSALQWVRRHPQAGGATVTLAPAVVSAALLTNSGANMTLYLQVPPALNIESGYPFFSALKTFGLSNASPPAVGDCVIAQGTIALFRGATELSPATITATAGADCGGSPLIPYATTVGDSATDTDFNTSDNQPGSLAEALESVLVRLGPVDGKNNLPGEGFSVWDTGTVATSSLYVAPTLYGYFTGGTVQHLQITGVFDESDPTVPPPTNQYQLLPRSASDVVVLP